MQRYALSDRQPTQLVSLLFLVIFVIWPFVQSDLLVDQLDGSEGDDGALSAAELRGPKHAMSGRNASQGVVLAPVALRDVSSTRDGLWHRARDPRLHVGGAASTTSRFRLVAAASMIGRSDGSVVAHRATSAQAGAVKAGTFTTGEEGGVLAARGTTPTTRGTGQGEIEQLNESKDYRTELSDERMRSLVKRRFGVASVCDLPAHSGQPLGCSMGCPCDSWISCFVLFCYPHYVGVHDTLPNGEVLDFSVDVGVCGPSPFGMVVFSLVFFMICFFCFMTLLLHLRRVQNEEAVRASRACLGSGASCDTTEETVISIATGSISMPSPRLRSDAVRKGPPTGSRRAAYGSRLQAA
eukprot:TRINITY_DN9340_c0_g1_i1.p1 TRINITY_DN9340_c0_g1~~TRINITY_DN9340_c0_g1_i1.p1  ORF type:complete len:353 (-),score=18.72 TRINITY_DN9340_c0_g1_i1:128-1186(-)